MTTSSRSGRIGHAERCEDPALILTLTPTLTDALALFLEAHQLRPSDARFVLSAANMHLKLGELPEATELYAKLDGLTMTPRQQEMARTKRRMCADLQVARSCTLSLGRVRGCKPTQLPPPTHHPRISRASAGGQVGRARPRRALGYHQGDAASASSAAAASATAAAAAAAAATAAAAAAACDRQYTGLSR